MLPSLTPKLSKKDTSIGRILDSNSTFETFSLQRVSFYDIFSVFLSFSHQIVHFIGFPHIDSANNKSFSCCSFVNFLKIARNLFSKSVLSSLSPLNRYNGETFRNFAISSICCIYEFDFPVFQLLYALLVNPRNSTKSFCCLPCTNIKAYIYRSNQASYTICARKDYQTIGEAF